MQKTISKFEREPLKMYNLVLLYWNRVSCHWLLHFPVLSTLLDCYLNSAKERPVERPVIFWGKKLISDFRESVPGRSLHGTLFGTLFRDAFPGRSVGLFRGNPRFSRKNAENRRFSEIFAEKIGFTWVFTEKVRKKSLFSAKKWLFSSKKKIIIDFSKNVPKASRDALCVENTQRASKTLFAWDAPRDALLGS